MSEDNPNDKFLGKLAEGVYEDGLKPSMTNLGETIGFLFKAIAYYPKFWGRVLDIRWEAKVENFQAEFKERFSKVPVSNLISPDPRISGPVVQALEYSIFDDDIRKMFASLLASACDVESDAHPAFTEIIKQLTSEEAKLISEYSMDWINGDFPETLPLTKFYVETETVIAGNNRLYRSKKVLPHYRMIIEDLKHDGMVDGKWFYVIYEYPDNYDFEGIIASINNLERLGIFRFETDYRETISGNSMTEIYRRIKSFINGFFRDSAVKNNFEFRYEVAYLTRFGRRFVNACVTNEEGTKE